LRIGINGHSERREESHISRTLTSFTSFRMIEKPFLQDPQKSYTLRKLTKLVQKRAGVSRTAATGYLSCFPLFLAAPA
jgi:hypothetical protein